MFKMFLVVSLSLFAACGVEQPDDLAPQSEIQAPPPTCAQVAAGRVSTTRKISAVHGVATGGELSAGSGVWFADLSNDMFDVPLDVSVGERIEQIAATVYVGSTVPEVIRPFNMTIYRQDAISSPPTDLGDYSLSELPGQRVLVISQPAAPGFATEDVVNGITTYWVHFRFNRPPAGEVLGRSAVGGISLTTSLPSTSQPPGC